MLSKVERTQLQNWKHEARVHTVQLKPEASSQQSLSKLTCCSLNSNSKRAFSVYTKQAYKQSTEQLRKLLILWIEVRIMQYMRAVCSSVQGACTLYSVHCIQGRSVTKIWGRDEGKNTKGPPWLQNAKQQKGYY